MFHATAIILAGGKSSRMGQDKGLLTIDKTPMIEFIYKQLSDYFPEIILSCQSNNKVNFTNVRTVVDESMNHGPLMGIVSSIEKSKNNINFVTACDMPDVKINLIAEMLSLSNNYDIVVPVTAEDKYEPLFAVYSKGILPAARIMLSEGECRITDLFKSVNVKVVRLEKDVNLVNINDNNDYNSFINK